MGTPTGAAFAEEEEGAAAGADSGGIGMSRFLNSRVSHRCTESSDLSNAEKVLSLSGAGSIDLSASLALQMKRKG